MGQQITEQNEQKFFDEFVTRLGTDPFSKGYYKATDIPSASSKSHGQNKCRKDGSLSPRTININVSNIDCQSRNESSGLFSGVTKVNLGYSTL